MIHTYLLEIELSEPTALTDGSSDAGGGHTTLDHIPGTSLLGAFVTALGISPTDDLFRRVFLSPSTRFLNAYPATQSQGRTLPRPLTFRVGKLNRGRLFDSISVDGKPVAYERIQSHFASVKPADTMKSSRGVFVAEDAPEFEYAPQRIEQVHVGIDRTKRSAEDGVLFTYEAVRAGTKFLGVIETDDDRAAEIFAKHGTVDLRIGRSRSAGYGHARAQLKKASADWREYSPAVGAHPGSTVITLLSDYIPHLEVSPAAALRAELASLVGVKVDQVEVRSANTRQIRGFRGVWGLPRPTRTALAKGSVLVIAQNVEAKRISDALSKGIGARTNEGFGRVAVNWAIHGKLTEGNEGQLPAAHRDKQLRPTIAINASMTTAINARRTERKVREFVEVALRLKRVTSASDELTRLQHAQLGNLRAAVSGTMSPAEIGTWFKALSEKTAGARWKRIDVPALASGKPRRAAHAFVWESLFGGRCSSQDALEGTISLEVWKSALEALAKQIGRPDLTDAAMEQPDTALRYFIAGFVSDVSRRRNTCIEQEGTR